MHFDRVHPLTGMWGQPTYQAAPLAFPRFSVTPTIVDEGTYLSVVTRGHIARARSLDGARALAIAGVQVERVSLTVAGIHVRASVLAATRELVSTVVDSAVGPLALPDFMVEEAEAILRGYEATL